jgi:hypothetical protein
MCNISCTHTTESLKTAKTFHLDIVNRGFFLVIYNIYVFTPISEF